MDHLYLSGRVKALQNELVEIAEHNHKYFARKDHSRVEKFEHQELRERLLQIRAELYALMEKSTQKAA